MIFDIFTKSAHFIPVKSTYSTVDNAKIFIDVVMCCHSIPLSIISVRGTQFTQFTSTFWGSLREGLGTKVKLSTAFRPQRDCQEECTIQTRENMVRACIIDFKENLDKYLPLVESFITIVFIHPYPCPLVMLCMVEYGCPL